MLFANGCLQDCIHNVKGGRGERGEAMGRERGGMEEKGDKERERERKR